MLEKRQTNACYVKVAVTVAGAVTAGAGAVESLEGSDRLGLEAWVGVKRLQQQQCPRPGICKLPRKVMYSNGSNGSNT